MAKTICPECGKRMDLDDYNKNGMCFNCWEKARQIKYNMPDLTPGLTVEFRSENLTVECEIVSCWMASNGIQIQLKFKSPSDFPTVMKPHLVFSNLAVHISNLKWDIDTQVIWFE